MSEKAFAAGAPPRTLLRKYTQLQHLSRLLKLVGGGLLPGAAPHQERTDFQ